MKGKIFHLFGVILLCAVLVAETAGCSAKSPSTTTATSTALPPAISDFSNTAVPISTATSTTIAPPSSTTNPSLLPTTSAMPQTSITAKDVELGYDSGKPSGTLAMRGWGYVVKFAPNCQEFVIKQVAVYGNLYGTEHTGQVCELRIMDGNQNSLYSTSFPHTAFSSGAGWLRIDIPKITVRSPFYVMFFTNSPRTDGVTVSYDITSVNGGSAIMDQWKIIEWPAEVTAPDKNRCNWMIRVTGASANLGDQITSPLPAG